MQQGTAAFEKSTPITQRPTGEKINRKKQKRPNLAVTKNNRKKREREGSVKKCIGRSKNSSRRVTPATTSSPPPPTPRASKLRFPFRFCTKKKARVIPPVRKCRDRARTNGNCDVIKLGPNDPHHTLSS
ncbi:hypothetical protein TNCV_4696031 [Trichonephila clavipes]|nr:hypothetical protein TNCV_4696031 [Trichonephila clavipes]